MNNNHKNSTLESKQLKLTVSTQSIVHYFDSNGALRSGYLIRRIKQGKQKGMVVVSDSAGHQIIPERIRNIE